MCFIRTYIYTRSGMLIHNLSALPTTIAKPFLSFWQEIRFLPDISAWLGSGTGVVPAQIGQFSFRAVPGSSWTASHLTDCVIQP